MSKLTPQDLHEYQRECILHGLYWNNVMFWLQVGLGKTIVALTLIVDRMRAGLVTKTIVFGPKKVVYSVWKNEVRKWTHTQGLRCMLVEGPPHKRLEALFAPADIYLINYENMNWLAAQLKRYYADRGRENPFDMVVYDEVSMCKNSTSRRIAGGVVDITKKDRNGNVVNVQKVNKIGWRTVINSFKYTVGLTGTPVSNGYPDLHGQFLVVDGGERLGEYESEYLETYFYKNRNGFGHSIKPESKNLIEAAISDITKKMDAKDYLSIPETLVQDRWIELPEKARKHYEDLETQLFTELDLNVQIEVQNNMCLSNKCLQVANGNPYLDLEGNYTEMHKAKLEALDILVEEANGAPILLGYSFKSDAEVIMKRYRKLNPVNLSATKSNLTDSVVRKFQDGGIQLLLGHPKSMGYGLDGLQDSCNIVVWFGLPWNLEWYLQLIGRIGRQGQTKVTSVFRILCKNTTDEAVRLAIESKNDTQEGLKLAMDRYRRSKTMPTFR